MKYIDKIDAVRHMLYRQYRRAATVRRSLVFEISYEQFEQFLHKPCKYCGRSNVNSISYDKKRFYLSYNGIDRIDNDVGYVIGNLQTVCGPCNFAKKQLGVKEFEQWVEALVNHRLSSVSI